VLQCRTCRKSRKARRPRKLSQALQLRVDQWARARLLQQQHAGAPEQQRSACQAQDLVDVVM